MSTGLAAVEPPAALDAERAFLGAILLLGLSDSGRSRQASTVGLLRAEHFYSPEHRAIFGTVLDLLGAGQPVDPITVAGRLRATPAREGVRFAEGRDLGVVLHDLMDATPCPASAGWYADLVADAAVRRRVWEAGRRLEQAATRPMSLGELRALLLTEVAEVEATWERPEGPS